MKEEFDVHLSRKYRLLSLRATYLSDDGEVEIELSVPQFEKEAILQLELWPSLPGQPIASAHVEVSGKFKPDENGVLYTLRTKEES